MSNKIVFLSYSHDSDEHREKVLALSERLRADGIETRLDQYENGTPEEGWPRWMLNQLDAAEFVLVVCTETYHRRFRGHEKPGVGKGVDWEGALITAELYHARSQSVKFVPVFFSEVVVKHIPEPLHSATHYALTSEAAYQSLYDFLLQQSGVEPHPVGVLKTKKRRKGTPLSFGEAAPRDPLVDISRIVKYAPADLIGREAELQLLNDAWSALPGSKSPHPRVLTFVALGGEGKTSLVAKWAAELAAQDWPECDAVFAWSFYRQGTGEQLAASSDLFLTEALTFFGDADMAKSSAGAFDKGRRLAQLVGERRTLLILDGVEPLQYAPTSPTPGELKDQGLAALLKGLASSSKGLCAVTTRCSLPDLRAFKDKTVLEKELKRLSTDAGVHLLQQLGVRKESGSKSEFEKLVEDVKGHALTLTLLGGFLKRAFHGDIRQRDRMKFEKADEKMYGGHAFRTMEAYEQWLLRDGGDEGRREVAVLRLMGLFDRPADAGCLTALRRETIPGLTEPLTGLAEDDWEYCLSGLEAAKLLTVNRDSVGAMLSLDAHPLIREYFSAQVRGSGFSQAVSHESPRAETKSGAWREAHRRIYEHLCSTTEDKLDATLEDLQPLYQAVAHGCFAEKTENVLWQLYDHRLQRGDLKYATKQLGAMSSTLGALACFFAKQWDVLVSGMSRKSEARVYNEAAVHLRIVGRSTEAVQPSQLACKKNAESKDWVESAVSFGNHAELLLSLGNLNEALLVAEKAVAYADLSPDKEEMVYQRSVMAEVLLASWRLEQANRMIRAAERIQAQREENRPQLYSMPGFRKHSLILAPLERIAWRCQMQGAVEQVINLPKVEPSVRELARQALRHARSNAWLFAIALHEQTIGEEIILHELTSNETDLQKHRVQIELALQHLNSSVIYSRKCGVHSYIVRSLRSRSWGYYLSDDIQSARKDLDEAWEIASRGPMPLYMADIHLYRARLFGSSNKSEKYPWESAEHDLAEARRLIEKHGYVRRMPELEDAERARLGR